VRSLRKKGKNFLEANNVMRIQAKINGVAGVFRRLAALHEKWSS
jgi:hypothetical protein